MTRRSLTSTLPADVAPSSRAWLSDRPGWCVDVGATLVAMRTADLWLALAKDEVTPKTKVWREGMPYWTELENVPEFALAMPDAVVWAPGDGPKRPGALDKPSTSTSTALGRPLDKPSIETSVSVARSVSATPSVGSGERVTRGVSRSDPLVAGGVTLAPPSDFMTPAPVVVEHRGSEHASHGSRRIFPRMDRRGAMSVALGAIVAIAALTFATTGPTASHGATTSSGSPVAVGARAHGPAIDFAAIVRVPPPVVAAPSIPAPAALEAAPTMGGIAPTVTTARVRPGRGPRAADRGQRRAR